MPKDEMDTVSDLRYSWKKLRKLATEVSDGLAKLQVNPGSAAHMHMCTGKPQRSLMIWPRCTVGDLLQTTQGSS